MASKKPRYEWEGKPVQSVTEVLSMLNKPALVPWAVKLAAESVDTQLQDFYDPEQCCFIVPDTALPQLIKTAKGAYRNANKEATDLGTAVHNAINAWIESGGIMQPAEIEDLKVRQGLQAFLDYGETVNLEIVANEKQIFGWLWAIGDGHPLYAGRFDLLARINGILTMIDIKTSKAIYDEYWIQLEAYRVAEQRSNAEIDEIIKQVAIFRIDMETGELEPEIRPCNHRKYIAFKSLAAARQIMNEEK